MDRTGHVTADELNLRPTPSTAGAPLAQLDRGQAVTVVDTQGAWYRVVVDGRAGWVARAFVALDPAQLATITDPVERALSIVGQGGMYVLGTGDYHPSGTGDAAVDLPWTEKNGLVGADCAGFAISWCHRLVRHRPGFNHSATATVSDDLNTDSAIEDAQTHQELFTLVTDAPRAGDLLVYKTIPRVKIGHVAICVADAPAGWDPATAAYEQLTVAQCKGPNGRAPGVIRTDGSIWSQHDATFADTYPASRTVVLRVKA